MKISITQSLFVIYIKNLLITYVGLGINGVKLSTKNYIKTSLYLTTGELILTVLLRGYIENIYILKSYILCLLLIILYKVFTNIDWVSAAISSLSGFVILLLGRVINFKILNYGFNIKIGYIFKSKFLYLNILDLFNVPLLISAWLVYRFSFILFDLDNEEFKFYSK